MDDLRHLMLDPDSSARQAMAGDLGIAIVSEQGWVGLTPASLAAAVGCTRQAVHQWFGDQEALRLVFARVFSGRWQRWTQARLHTGGVTALLPSSEESLHWGRVWLALAEQSTRDPELAALAEHLRVAESAALLRHLERALDRDRGIRLSLLPPLGEGLGAAVDGVRSQVCRGLPMPTGRRILDHLVTDQLESLMRGFA
jgi:AcrR family transcriptional regulator